jgi:probable F420-dependent oxidoreductase
MRIGISLPVRELKDDLGALKAFAQAADDLGYTHLRVPDQVIRPNSGHLHEPLMVLSYIAAVTRSIELVPSVVVAPARQTALLAKQLATLERMAGGGVRLGIGVGGSAAEYAALGQDFHTRGRRCEEQIDLLRRLWAAAEVDFEGRWDRVQGNGIDPLPGASIPIWIGAAGVPVPRIRQRIGRQADGWFVLCAPEQFDDLKTDIDAAARAAGRDPASIGTEAGVAVVGPREAEWQERLAGWRDKGLTHLCLRTLGGGLDAHGHLAKARAAFEQLPT